MHRWERTTRICQRVGESVTVTRSTFLAGGFLFGCWTSRAFGSACLLMALGTGFSPRLALVILCLAAAAAVVPITTSRSPQRCSSRSQRWRPLWSASPARSCSGSKAGAL
jgi:hypothetical protein